MKKTKFLLTLILLFLCPEVRAALVRVPVTDFPLQGREARLNCDPGQAPCPAEKAGPFLSGDGKTAVFRAGEGFQINDRFFEGELIFCAISGRSRNAAAVFQKKTAADKTGEAVQSAGYCAWNSMVSCVTFPVEILGALAGGRGRRQKEAPALYTKYIAFSDGRILKADKFEPIGLKIWERSRMTGISFRTGKEHYIWYNGSTHGPYEFIKGKYLSPGGKRLVFSYTSSGEDYVVADGKKLGPFKEVLAVIINDEGDYGIHLFDGTNERVILNGRDTGPLRAPRLVITGNPTEYSIDYYLYSNRPENESPSARRYYRDDVISAGAPEIKDRNLGLYHLQDLYRQPAARLQIGYHHVRNGKRMIEIAGRTFGPYESIHKAVWNRAGTEALVMTKGKEGFHVHTGRQKLGPYSLVKHLFFTYRDEPAFIYLAKPDKKMENSRSHSLAAYVWHNGKTSGPYDEYYLKLSPDRGLFFHVQEGRNEYRVLVNGRTFGPYSYVPNINQADARFFNFEFQTADATLSAMCNAPLADRVYNIDRVQPPFIYNPDSGALAYLYESGENICLYWKGNRHTLFSRQSIPDNPEWNPDLSVYAISHVPADRKGRYCWVNGDTAGPFPVGSRLLLRDERRLFIVYQDKDRVRVEELKKDK